MDLRTVMTISTFLLMTAETEQTTVNSHQVINETIPATTNSTSRSCTCPTAAPPTNAASTPTPTSSTPAPTLSFLTIKWKSECTGEVQLTLYLSPETSLPVCHDSEINEKSFQKSLFKDVCQNKAGCKGPMRKMSSTSDQSAYDISGAQNKSCQTLMIRCSVADAQGQQLQAYKVVTALLCCVLVVLLLIRFTKPTVKALQKRLSDRRQNRWIGPTQSHSVSYHRGKTAVKNNDGEKRLSYPALERLTVSDSREPSSNRNSGYTF